MSNFRQFYGTQQIDFAIATPNYPQNVTVIFGENGRGKTGIFRAVMFCLFGSRLLSQDEQVAKEELYLINTSHLLESSMNNEKAEAFIELHFQHKQNSYALKRTLIGCIEGEKRIEQVDKAILFETLADGNTKSHKDIDKINQMITEILDEKVKEYFLFDGEKIQRLTLATIDQKKEISRGIRNLLNVDSLEKAIRATQKLSKNLDKELSRKATGEFGKVLNSLKVNEEELERKNTELEKSEEEHNLAQKEKKQIDRRLDEYEEIRQWVEKRNYLETRIKELDELSDKLLIEMKTKTGKASFFLIKNTIESVFENIEKRKQKGEIPSEIRQDLIEKIFEQKKCICGREIITGTEPFFKIRDWKNKACDHELENSALEIWRYLSSIKSHMDDVSTSVDTYLQRYAVTRNEIEKLRQEVEFLNEKIGESERKDAGKLQKIREKLDGKIIKLLANIELLKADIEELSDQQASLEEQRKKLETEEFIKEKLAQEARIAFEANKALIEIYEQFTREIKEDIAKKANNYFSQLLDKEGKETLGKIIVNDDYSLQILDKWGKPFLANISAGQRQIMSISFIAALAKVAAPDSIFEMPFFMDTPFSRLSVEHRKNLIQKIPTFCAQWILLATDTEFRMQEAEFLSQSNRWGKFYRLYGKGPGITHIQEHKTNEFKKMILNNRENSI